MREEDERYSDWVEGNQDSLLELYIEDLDIEDMPEHIKCEIATDEVDEWDTHFRVWIESLSIDDVPDEWLQRRYEVEWEDKYL